MVSLSVHNVFDCTKDLIVIAQIERLNSTDWRNMDRWITDIGAILVREELPRAGVIDPTINTTCNVP